MPNTNRLFMPLQTELLEKREFKLISLVELKVQDMTVGSLSVAGYQRMNLNTVGTLLNMLENVATENNLSNTPENIFNIDEIGVQKIINLNL